MAKFVCPECDNELENGRSSIISQAINHMKDEHDNEVSREYVKGVIDAHGGD